MTKKTLKEEFTEYKVEAMQDWVWTSVPAAGTDVGRRPSGAGEAS